MVNKAKTIEATTDYDQFSLIEGNRPLNKGLILSLEESILNEGNYLETQPIIVNEKMEIIDGQHRWAVAKNLQKELFYIVSKGATLREAKIWNSRKRQWLSVDYLRAYLQQGDRAAQTLAEFMQEYKLSIAISAKLLMKTPNGSRAMKYFREGKFEIRDLAWAQNVAGIVLTVRQHSPDYAFSHAQCIGAIAKLYDQSLDKQEFEKKLTQYQTTVTRRRSVKEYLQQFQLILDMGGASKTRLM